MPKVINAELEWWEVITRIPIGGDDGSDYVTPWKVAFVADTIEQCQDVKALLEIFLPFNETKRSFSLMQARGEISHYTKAVQEADFMAIEMAR